MSPTQTDVIRSSDECVWTRMLDILHPLELYPVRFRIGCNQEVAQGAAAIYPDVCPHCRKRVSVARMITPPSTLTPGTQTVPTSNARLTVDDAHDPKKCELLDQIYRQAYDDFAGPVGRRHAVNFDTYNRAGLIAVWNAAQDAVRSAHETRACHCQIETHIVVQYRDCPVHGVANTPKAKVVPSICGKPMPDGKGAGQCINPPGHEGDCDDMPF